MKGPPKPKTHCDNKFFAILPSDTKSLLMKNHSEIIIFVKITKFTRNSLKKSLFPGNCESVKGLKNYKKNSQGIIFVIISCQRVSFTSVFIVRSGAVTGSCDPVSRRLPRQHIPGTLPLIEGDFEGGEGVHA